jgi:hypothetical protein
MRRAKAEGRTHSPYAKKEVADFSRIYHQLRWNVDFVGVQVGRRGVWGGRRGCMGQDRELCVAFGEVGEGVVWGRTANCVYTWSSTCSAWQRCGRQPPLLRRTPTVCDGCQPMLCPRARPTHQIVAPCLHCLLTRTAE